MMNAKRIARGQIWHWIDPIYGDKSNGDENYISGENTIRYSRYVLIVQVEPRDDSVLAIPLSSKYNKNTDYRVPVWNSRYGETFSYLKIDRVFSVFPEQLNDYVCTVNDDVLKLVEAELIRLLIPSVYNNNSIGEILMNDGLPLDQVSEDHWEDEEMKPGVFTIVAKFIKRHIRNGIGSVTSAGDLYQAYIVWCYDNGYIPPERMSSFMNVFCVLMHLPLTDKYESSTYKNIRIDGIEIPVAAIPDEVISEPEQQEEAETKVVESKPSLICHTKKKWDDTARARFLAFEETHSIEETAAEFAISRNSVYKYRKLFGQMAEQQKPEETQSADVDVIEERNDEDNGWVDFGELMKKVRKTISDMSNFIKDDMEANNAFDYTSKDSVFRNSPYMDKESFYGQISAGVYYSLMEYLEIKESKATRAFYHAAPKTLVQSRSYMGIEQIHDLVNEGYTPYQVRCKIKEDGAEGIDHRWVPYLSSQLSFRLNLTPENISNIVGMIESNYCSKRPLT